MRTPHANAAPAGAARPRARCVRGCGGGTGFGVMTSRLPDAMAGAQLRQPAVCTAHAASCARLAAGCALLAVTLRKRR